MRKIQFRGKLENGTWKYGEFIRTDIGFCITSYEDIDLDCCASSVDSKFFGKITSYKFIPKTVGQFTGLTDKNGKEIYEGDIVFIHTGFKKNDFDSENTIYKGQVVFNQQKVCFQIDVFNFCGSYWFGSVTSSKLEIIGNIHDTPELLTNK